MIIFPVKTIKTSTGVKKVPAVKKGQNWQNYKCTAEELEHSDNYGVVIPDGVIVIDLDTQKGVTRSDVETALGCELDWQLLQKTISGGEHYAFSVPNDLNLRQGSDLLDVKGFDTRCAGRGWICSGKGYEFDIEVYESLRCTELPKLPRRAQEALKAAKANNDDLMSLVLAEPLEGFDEARCRDVISSLPDSDVNGYDTWLHVGMALHHQSGGKRWGIKLWNEWSKKSSSYDLAEIKTKWRSFEGGRGAPVTMATIVKRAETALEHVGTQVNTDRLTSVPSENDGKTIKKGVNLIQCAEFTQFEPPEWLIKGVLPKSDLNCIYGAPGSGKTFLALDMCLSIARGEPWRGHRVAKRKVAYIAAEGARGVSLRIQAYAQKHELDVSELPFFVSADCPNMLDRFDVADVLDAIESVGDVDLVVLDTLAQCSAGGDENSGKDMGQVLSACKLIGSETGATVLLIHHSGKDESRGARGWSGLRGALDSEISVCEKDGCKIARVTKQKDGEAGKEYCFGLEQVVLGLDSDGDEVSSCVVVEAERVLPPVHFKSTYQQAVYEYLCAELPIDGSIERIAVGDLVSALIDQFDKPECGRDTRKRNLTNAIKAVCDHKDTVYSISDEWVFFA